MDALLTCEMLQRLSEVLYEELVAEGEAYRCLRRLLQGGKGEGEALATLILTASYILMYLSTACSGRTPQLPATLQAIPLPDTILRAIYEREGALASIASTLAQKANSIVNIVIHDSVVIGLRGASLLYLPNPWIDKERLDQYYDVADSFGDLLIQNTISIAGTLLEKAGIQDLYSTYAKLQLSKELKRIIQRCLWRKLRKIMTSLLLDREAVVMGSREDSKTPWSTYTLFRRTLSLRQEALSANSLVEIVDAIHKHGLLEDYNNVIKKIGLKDPIIKNREVHVYAIDSGISVPAALLGDGTLQLLMQLLILLAGLVLARKKPRTVLVLEEPETGLHPGYMTVLVDNMARAVKENPSAIILLSTHSIELIRFIVKRAEKHNVIDKVKTILMSQGEVYSVFQGREALEASKIGAELRGI